MTTSIARTTGEHAAAVRPLLPKWGDVLREQFRVIGLSLRIPLLLAFAAGLFITIVVAMDAARGNWPPDIHAEPLELPGVVGFLFPIAVWLREDRFGPGFFWTLPVEHSRHALARVVAGWLWLMLGVLLFSLAILLFTLLSGGNVFPEETIRVLTQPVSRLDVVDASLLRDVRWAPSPLIWAVPFTAATVTYMFGSAVLVGLRHWMRWVAGAVLLFAQASAASEIGDGRPRATWGANAPERAVSFLCESRYGLDALVTVRTATLDRRATLDSGERIHAWSAAPRLADWAIATLLWGGAGLLALLAAVSRHRERRRA